MSPINITPSQILIENFNHMDVQQSIVEITNRQTHSIRLKVSLNESSGFKIVDVMMPKIANQPVGTLAPGMAVKVHVIFKSTGDDQDVSAKIEIKVESFNEVFEIPCNATNRPPQLKQLGVDKQNQHIFYSGMCWVGERIDSVFRVQNEGGSCWIKLHDLEKQKQQNRPHADEPVFKRHGEDVLNLEENHPKLKVLQGFNKYVDKKQDEDKDQTNDTPMMSMRPQEPQPLEVNPFAVIPSEFFLESDSQIDLYVIFNPKIGEFATRSIGFFANESKISQFELNGVGLQVNLGQTMYNNFSMNKVEQLELENIQLNDVELNKPHFREFSIQNMSPLPVKMKWDYYNKENPQTTNKRLSIMPNELSIGPEAEQTFTLSQHPESAGYEIQSAILNVENIHKLALSKSKVISDINDKKFKYNLVGNTSHVTLPQFKLDIECFVVNNQVEIVKDVEILQAPVTIFSKNSQSIGILNPSKAQVVVRIAEFMHHNLIMVGCNEIEVNQALLIDPGEEKEIKIHYIPQITGNEIITTKFSIDGGEPVYHEFSFSISGPQVTVANINSLVVDVKPNSGKKFPVVLKNNSDVDAEVLFLYSKYNNQQFNYHFINNSIKDDQYGFDTQHKNNMVEQLGLQTIREFRNSDSMIHSSYSRKKLSEKSVNEKVIPKQFNAASVVNSFFKVDLKSPCQNEALLELDTTIPYFIIPAKSSQTVNVKINTPSVLETEFTQVTKQSGSKSIPVNIGIDTRKKKRDRSGINTPTNQNVTSQNPSMNSSGIEFRSKKQSIENEKINVNLPVMEPIKTSRGLSQTNFKKKENLKEPMFDAKQNEFSKMFI